MSSLLWAFCFAGLYTAYEGIYASLYKLLFAVLPMFYAVIRWYGFVGYYLSLDYWSVFTSMYFQFTWSKCDILVELLVVVY